MREVQGNQGLISLNLSLPYNTMREAGSEGEGGGGLGQRIGAWGGFQFYQILLGSKKRLFKVVGPRMTPLCY